MLSLATFGAGFLMRPLGAIFLGAYIDRHGRRKGLIITLAMMAAGTVLIACLPGYATLGVAAPLSVLFGWVLPGFSAGVELGGVSVAVLGTGPDVPYPRGNAGLHAWLADAGAVVSEHWPGTGPRKEHFPSRNRILAGLALGTVVIEAAERSGALITARLAADAGREVFALPGSIHNPLARGCHRLIRDGACLVQGPDEVMAQLADRIHQASADLRRVIGAPIQDRVDTAAHPAVTKATRDDVALPAGSPPNPPADDPDHQTLWQALGHDPTSMDRLVERTGLTPAVLSSMLLPMELEGTVATQHGPYHPNRRRLAGFSTSSYPPRRMRRRPREMKESILDVLLYLFEHYFTEDADLVRDRDSLRSGPLFDELGQAGFSPAEINKAIEWLDALSEQRPSPSPRRADGPTRIYFGPELDKLDVDCRGFVLFLEQHGVLDAGQRELVLDRAMALDQDQVDLDDLKWVVLMVLFNQPGSEAAYAWMETQMFDDEPELVH